MRLLLCLTLLALVLGGCTGPAKATDIPEDQRTAAARKLYVNKCAKCHKFYDPAKYSDDEWQLWMVKMGKKAKLKPDQQTMLSEYIDQTYRAPARTNALPRQER